MTDQDSVLLEDVNHKLDAILEDQAAMGRVPRQLDDIESRLHNIEADVTTIRTIVTGHSRQFGDHESRLATLERAA